MAHANNSVTVARPIEEVFDFLADGTNNTRWRPSVIEIARSGGPDGVGATYKQGLKRPWQAAHRRRLSCDHVRRAPGAGLPGDRRPPEVSGL